MSEEFVSKAIDDLLIERRKIGYKDYSKSVARVFLAMLTVEKINTLTRLLDDIDLNIGQMIEQQKGSYKDLPVGLIEDIREEIVHTISDTYADIVSEVTDEQHKVWSKMDFIEIGAFEELCGE